MHKQRTDDYRRFRKEYPEFIYRGYDFSLSEDALEINYRFSIPGLADFRPHWKIDRRAIGKRAAAGSEPSVEIDEALLDDLVFSLGMVELVSYWKACCSPHVRIDCGHLCKEQIAWWKKLYFKGLGEFFYTNGIAIGAIAGRIAGRARNDDTEDFTGGDFMEIESSPGTRHDNGIRRPRDHRPPTSATPVTAAAPPTSATKVLVPIGGGKDSAVSLELLKGSVDRYGYIINPRQATLDTARVAKLADKTLVAQRSLDPALLELNADGFLNGHTPFSAVVAFSSIIAAYLNGIEYVALSNESSANEATIAGSDVNHQYSKSTEFERDFRDYERRYLGSGIEYFSLLRPLTELRIAQLFSRFTEYHDIFRSCNAGSKQDKWCGKCSKCLFVYIILSPFLSTQRMLAIFGAVLLDDPDLIDIFEKLIGLQAEKPFECVGSRDEVCAALEMTRQKYLTEGRELPVLLRHCEEKKPEGKSLSHSDEELRVELLDFFDEKNFLPPFFRELLIQRMKDA